jgi:cystathionine beta-synthase
VEGVPYKVEGIGQDKIPGTLDMSLIDDYVTVSDRDAFAMARRLTREEGLFAGGSSGLITHVALQLAKRIDDPDAFVVTFLCDTGERYLSKLYSDEWMRENQMLETEHVTVGHLLAQKSGDAPTLVSVAPSAAVRQALGLMALHDVSQLAVMDAASCVGLVSESGLSTRALENTKLLDAPVAEVMDPPLPIVDADASLEQVTRILSKVNPAVLVQRSGRIEGILTRSDVLHYVMKR